MIEAEDPVVTRLRNGLQGRYTIKGQVGRGGMAFVYEAIEISHQRRVAMKVLRPEIAASLGSERFSREIRITANLSHPHILPVHDAGEVDGLLYYVMPFVDGESLRDRLQRERTLPVDDALRIAREVGQALSYSHGLGVVHRDLKPENIMLATGVAVVADFGIARGAAFAGGGDQLTVTGMAMGTPAYMSPEQATGESSLDGRSDIYSLACVVYEMLAGVPPYSGANLYATLALHATKRPPDVRKLRPDAPAEVSEAIMIALSKQPAERFLTVGDFVSALEGIRFSIAGRHQAARTRRRGRVALLLLGAAAVVAGAVWLGGRLGGAPSLPDGGPVVAVLPFEHIGPPEDEYVTQGITNEISNSMSSIGGISVISRASAMQFDPKRRPLADVKRELQADYVVTGSVQTNRQSDGSTQIRLLTQFQGVDDPRPLYADSTTATLNSGALFEIQQRIAQQVATALDLTLRPQTLEALRQGQTTKPEAYRAYLQGSIHASQFLVRPEQLVAIGHFEQATTLDPGFALAWARLAQVTATYYSLYDKSPARLAKLQEAVHRADSLRPADAETRIARGYLALFSARDAEGAMREFTAARDRLPNSSELLWAIGFTQRHRGRIDSSFASFMEASRLDPRSQQFAFEAATAAFLQRRYAESMTLLARARALMPTWFPATLGAASVRLSMGQLDSARAAVEPLAAMAGPLTPFLVGEPGYRTLWELVLPAAYQDALAGLSLANPLVDSVGYYYNKGRLLLRRRQPAAAQPYFDSLRTVQRRRLHTGNVNAYTAADIAAASAALGDTAGALAYVDSTLTPDPVASDALRGSFVLTDIARLYVSIGQDAKAMALIRRLLDIPSPLSPGLLRVDPRFARLRGQPEFDRLLQGAP